MTNNSEIWSCSTDFKLRHYPTPQVLYFHVETIPNYEISDLWLDRRQRPEHTEEKPESEWLDAQMKAMALQPEACKLVGLNVLIGEGEPKSGWVGETSPTGAPYTEEDLLTLFWQWAATSPRLVGFNCLTFDLNVIRVRSALLGVLPTVNLFDIKPWEDKVIDLLKRRFEKAPRDQYLSLKALRRLLGFQVPDKYAEVMDSTGADIEGLYLRFLSGDADALRILKLYGELDVWTTKALAQLWSGYFFQRIE
jgi:hypothetical protein